jgi:hypothetical protein
MIAPLQPKKQKSCGIGGVNRRFFFKPLAIAMALFVGLMQSAATAQQITVEGTPVTIVPPSTPPPITVFTCGGSLQILQHTCDYITPPGYSAFSVGTVSGTPPSKDLEQLESDAVNEYLADHDLPSTDASLIYQYGRADLRSAIRSQMLGDLIAIGQKAESAKTGHEDTLNNWFQYQMQQFEITYYQAAVNDKNSWENNPCAWTPDSDLAQQYGLNYNSSSFCNGPANLSAFVNISPQIPSAAYFLVAALKNVYGGALVNRTNALAIQTTTSIGLGEAAGIGAAAGVAGAIGAGAGFSSAAGALFPFSLGMDAAANITTDLTAGIVASGPAAIVLFMALIGVVATFEVLNSDQVLQALAQLDTSLAHVKANIPTFGSYLGDNTGKYKVTSVFTALTLPEYSSASPLPAHNPASDLNFHLSPSNTNTVSLIYRDGEGRTWSAQTYRGWFVQTCTTKCTTQQNIALNTTVALSDSLTPTLEVVDSSGTVWWASRSGTTFTLTKKFPSTTDDACPAGQSLPANLDSCRSYYTANVPYTDGNGNAGVFSLVTSPAFTSPASAFFTQGVPGTFTVTASGAPAPFITYLGGLPQGFSFTIGNGTALLSYNGTTALSPGAYTVQMNAANGSGVIQNLSVKVNAAPPQFVSSATANFIKGAPGSFTIQVTGNPPPKITSGSLHFPPADLNFVDNGNGAATISGTIPLNAPYCSGSTCNITGFINASTAPNVSTQQSLTIHVTSAVLPSLIPTSLVFTAGIPNTAQIVAKGTTLGAINNVCNTLPTWLTFTDNGNNTATLSGTPPLGAPPVGLDVIVSPPGVPADVICGLPGSNYTLSVNSTPIITSPPSATFTVGATGVFAATANTSDQVSMTGILPQGLTFFPSSGHGILSGSPAPGTGGTYPLEVTLGTTNPTIQKFTLTVNEAPSFHDPYSVDFYVNRPNSFPLTINGYPHAADKSQFGMQVTVDNLLPPGVNLVEGTNAEGFGNGQWYLTGAPTQLGSYQFQAYAQNRILSSLGTLTVAHSYTINVIPAPPAKTAPVITWHTPAAISFGTALSGAQLNATANVPGTFLYSPPIGTVLGVGSQTLSATFMPTDTTHYLTGSATTNITVNPAQATQGVNLVLTNNLSRVNGRLVLGLTITNTGSVAATNITLTQVIINDVLATPSPLTVGTLGPGSSIQVTLSWPGSVGASGQSTPLLVKASYSGGKLNSNTHVILP